VTVSEFTCIALGILFNILTFALGCSVGVTLKRKESPNDGRYRYENEGFEYYPDDPKD
jgi:hypothetical protein